MFQEIFNYPHMMPKDVTLPQCRKSDCIRNSKHSRLRVIYVQSTRIQLHRWKTSSFAPILAVFRPKDPETQDYHTPCGRAVEYAHRFPACCMRRQKACPDGSASTAWDYAGLLCNLYRNASPKCCHYSQTFRAKSSLNLFHT